MKKHQRWIGATAAFGAFALILSACAPAANNGGGGGNEGDGEPTEIVGADYNPQERDALEQGGEVTWPISEITPQQNGFHADATVDTQTLQAWFTPQVILAEPEGAAVLNPNYLEDRQIEEVDGKTVVTYTINPDAVWNDGTPIDWTAFETTWVANRSYDEGYNPSATDGYDVIESVEKGEDDKQVVVTFKQVYPWTDFMFSGLLHPAVNSPEIFNEGFIEEPHAEWGAGPYTIDTFDANGGTVTFVPNEKWWGEEPMLDKVTFRQLDDTAEINAFRNGEVDLTVTNTEDRLSQVQDMEDIEIYRAQRTSNNLLQINAEREQFADLAVREAIFKAVNRDQIKEVVWNGLDYTEEDAGSLNMYAFEEGYVDALTEAGWKFDVEEANAILDEAGWVAGDDGIREKDGLRLEGRLPTFGDDPVVEARARVLQTQLAEIGMELEIDARPVSDFSTVITTKDWDLVMMAFVSGSATGVQFMCQIYCTDSSLNLSATSTPEIDEKIAEINALPTKEEQNEAGMKLESEIMAETWGVLPLYSGPWINAVTSGLANLTPEGYTGLDLYGVQPVENTGWMAEAK